MAWKNQKKNKGPKPKNKGKGYQLAKGNNYTSVEMSNISFLDPHKYVVFKYVGTYILTATAGVGTQQIMRLNSGYDPDQTGTGHQPYGWDQMAALYNRYRVLRSRWKVRFGTSTGTVHVAVFPINGPLPVPVTTAATYENAVEIPYAKFDILGGGGAPTVKMGGSIQLNKLTGATVIEYLADDRYEAQMTTNPSEVMYLYAVMYNPTASSVSVTISIEMEYYTDLHDPIIVAGSSMNRREKTFERPKMEPALRVYVANNELLVPQLTTNSAPAIIKE